MTTGNLFKPEFSEKQLVAACFELDEWMISRACPWIDPESRDSHWTAEFGMAGVIIERALNAETPLKYLSEASADLRKMADFIDRSAERAQMYSRGARVSMRRLEQQLKERSGAAGTAAA